ncbi:GAF domain-containing SpoIIE family protein phosphatase [Dapis sp. BLCC M126]|uniref:GAF domain-containing SpoIIE family protein phosphatase n=1 Tax=Dapis sp. BLCC M126 TaxID=3400189 RepID=UPI003CF63BA4
MGSTEENLREELDLLRQEMAKVTEELAAFRLAQKVLTEVTTGCSSRPGGIIKAALQKTLDVCADVTSTEKGSLFLLDPASKKIVDAILTRTEVTPEQRTKLIGSVLDKGLAGWVSRNLDIGLIKDTEDDDRWLTLPNQPYIVRSALGVPIINGQDLRGIITLLHSEPNHFTPRMAESMLATAEQIGLVLENARLYGQLDTYSKALDHELEKGRQIQIDFLPYDIPKLDEWEIVACFHPAKQVAGDFYDAFPLDNDQIGLVIADVCDKGVGAALFMALFRSLIRIFSSQENKLQETTTSIINLAHHKALQAVRLTNDYVGQNHWQMSMFATLFFGVLDPNTGLLSYVNGGHEPLFIINQDGIKQMLNSTGPAVGMMPNMKFEIKEVQLEPGEILIGYTDGVTEAKSPEGKLFTDKKLKELVEKPAASASELIERIKNKLFDYMEDAAQFDDITMLAVRRN